MEKRVLKVLKMLMNNRYVTAKQIKKHLTCSMKEVYYIIADVKDLLRIKGIEICTEYTFKTKKTEAINKLYRLLPQDKEKIEWV